MNPYLKNCVSADSAGYRYYIGVDVNTSSSSFTYKRGCLTTLTVLDNDDTVSLLNCDVQQVSGTTYSFSIFNNRIRITPPNRLTSTVSEAILTLTYIYINDPTSTVHTYTIDLVLIPVIMYQPGTRIVYRMKFADSLNFSYESADDDDYTGDRPSYYDMYDMTQSVRFVSNGRSFKEIEVDSDGNMYYNYTNQSGGVSVYDYQSGWTNDAYRDIIIEGITTIPTNASDFINFLVDNVEERVMGYNFNYNHSNVQMQFYCSSNMLASAGTPIPSEKGLFTLSGATTSAGLVYYTCTPASPYPDDEDILYFQASMIYSGATITINTAYNFYVLNTRAYWSSTLQNSGVNWTAKPTQSVNVNIYLIVEHGTTNNNGTLPGTITLTKTGSSSTTISVTGTWSYSSTYPARIVFGGTLQGSTEGTYTATYNTSQYIFYVDSSAYFFYDLPLVVNATIAKQPWEINFNSQTFNLNWNATGSFTFARGATIPTGGMLTYALISAVDENGAAVTGFSYTSGGTSNNIYWSDNNHQLPPQTYTLTMRATAPNTSYYIETTKDVIFTVTFAKLNPTFSWSVVTDNLIYYHATTDGSLGFNAPYSSAGTFNFTYEITNITTENGAPRPGYFGLINNRIYWGKEALGSDAPLIDGSAGYIITLQATSFATEYYNSITISQSFEIDFSSGVTWEGTIPSTILLDTTEELAVYWDQYLDNAFIYTSNPNMISVIDYNAIYGVDVGSALITLSWEVSSDLYNYAVTKKVTVSGGRLQLSPTTTVVDNLNTIYTVSITEITEPNAVINLSWTSPNISVYDSTQSTWITGSNNLATAFVTGAAGIIQVRVENAFPSNVSITTFVSFSPGSMIYPQRTLVFQPVPVQTVTIPSYSVANNPSVVYNGSTYTAANLSWNDFNSDIMTFNNSTGTYPGNYTATVTLKYGYKFTNNTTSTNVIWIIPKNAVIINATLSNNSSATYAYGGTVPALGNTITGNIIDNYTISYSGNGSTNVTETLMATWAPSSTAYTITPSITFPNGGSNYYTITYGSAALTVIKGYRAIAWTNPTINSVLSLNQTGTCTTNQPSNITTFTTSNSSIISLSGATYTVVGVGTVTLTAAVAADAYYNAATSNLTLTTQELPGPVYTTPTAASGYVYDATYKQMFAAPGTVSTSGATMYYYANASTTPTDSTTGSSSYTNYTFKNVATYKVWYRISGTSTTAPVPWTQLGTVTISKADNVILWVSPMNGDQIPVGSTGTLNASAQFTEDTVSYTTSATSVLTISGTQYTAVGTASRVPITAYTTGTQNVNPAFATIYVDIDAYPTYTAPTQKNNITYTGSSIAPFNAGSATNGTMYYSIRDTAPIGFDNDTLTTPTTMKVTEAGTYKLWYAVKGNTGFKNIDWQRLPNDFVINRASNTITVNSPSGTISADGNWHDVSFNTTFSTVCTMTTSNSSVIEVFGTSYRPLKAGSNIVLTLTAWATDSVAPATKTITLTVT